ncbi:hypothetical protein EJ110_NYTH43247 [Nymphaea thermarum]|nr:hypothetical protein EJ110_NYTH43247 [Nymphaea thermarum]
MDALGVGDLLKQHRTQLRRAVCKPTDAGGDSIEAAAAWDHQVSIQGGINRTRWKVMSDPFG